MDILFSAEGLERRLGSLVHNGRGGAGKQWEGGRLVHMGSLAGPDVPGGGGGKGTAGHYCQHSVDDTEMLT